MGSCFPTLAAKRQAADSSTSLRFAQNGEDGAPSRFSRVQPGTNAGNLTRLKKTKDIHEEFE
jgi:hypothetical protein